jgi:hypothetical protein
VPKHSRAAIADRGHLIERPFWWFGSGGIYFACKCGEVYHLSETHYIGSDGEVVPGVRCDRCGFEDYLMLLEWGHEIKPMRSGGALKPISPAEAKKIAEDAMEEKKP